MIMGAQDLPTSPLCWVFLTAPYAVLYSMDDCWRSAAHVCLWSAHLLCPAKEISMDIGIKVPKGDLLIKGQSDLISCCLSRLLVGIQHPNPVDESLPKGKDLQSTDQERPFHPVQCYRESNEVATIREFTF